MGTSNTSTSCSKKLLLLFAAVVQTKEKASRSVSKLLSVRTGVFPTQNSIFRYDNRAKRVGRKRSRRNHQTGEKPASPVRQHPLHHWDHHRNGEGNILQTCHLCIYAGSRNGITFVCTFLSFQGCALLHFFVFQAPALYSHSNCIFPSLLFSSIS